MNKTRYLLIPVFTVAYAALISLGAECLLNLMGVIMASAIDSNVLDKYPRFIPFCIAVGLLALVALIVLFVFNLILSEKLCFAKAAWVIQIICALAVSIPLIKPWEMLFDYLHLAL